MNYRQPKPFESPFIVQPRQGIVEPRSDGAFKVKTITTRCMKTCCWCCRKDRRITGLKSLARGETMTEMHNGFLWCNLGTAQQMNGKSGEFR